jgi:hypothetical protein
VVFRGKGAWPGEVVVVFGGMEAAVVVVVIGV